MTDPTQFDDPEDNIVIDSDSRSVSITIPDTVDEARYLYRRNPLFNEAIDIHRKQFDITTQYGLTGVLYEHAGETWKFDTDELGFYDLDWTVADDTGEVNNG